MKSDIPIRSLCLKHTEDIVMVKTKIESIDKKLDGVDSTIKSLHQDLKDFREDTDKRYACKNVERIVYGLIALIGMVVISEILKMVMMK